MKNFSVACFVITLFFLPGLLSGQNKSFRPTTMEKAVYFDVSPKLSDLKLMLPAKGEAGLTEIPNRIGEDERFNGSSMPITISEDPVWQKLNGTYMPVSAAPIQNFEGISNLSGVYPPDPQGDIGLNHYIQVVNLNFAVYSRTGTLLLGPAALSTIWAGIPDPWNGTNSGDPIVLYDQASSRWIISQFSLPGYPGGSRYAELVAVSQTSDPTGAWYRYVFQFGTVMPDYPKLAVWPDGYYMSVNQFEGGGGVGACALERPKMLVGDPSASMVYFNLGSSADPWSMLPSDWDGALAPLPGEPNYFTYFNSWSSALEKYLKIWKFHVDWATPSNSTFSEAASLTTAMFDASICTATRGRCIPQPGTSIQLEAISDRLMYRLQYRNFGTYQAMVTNHTVDFDGNGHAGIRWYELRNTGTGWFIYQQGTYAPDNTNRWMGSVAMNKSGDIALGYSLSNGVSIYPGIRYTARHAGDPPGQMTVAEQTVINGSGSQLGTSCRWGDYSGMSVDPTDDNTFWFTSEYIQTTGNTTWRTRIASFAFRFNPSVVTLAASPVLLTSATLNGTINPYSLATSYHFEWGTTTAYGSSTPVLPAGSGSTPVSVSADISDLTPGTMYHFRLLADNSDGTSYGNDVTVIPGGVLLSTTVPSSVALYSASSGGTITGNGGSAVIARGVCWSTSAEPTIAGNHTTDGSGNGNFSSPITGLAPGITYNVRAYATNGVGTFYGFNLSFTTLSGIAILTTATPTSIISGSAISGGNITSDGGSPVTARGVCWSTLVNPTISDNHSMNGSGTGIFTSNMTGLLSVTTYHVRAYAINGVSNYYGADLSFLSACTTLIPPVNESFTAATIPLCWSQSDHQGNGQIWQFGTISSTCNNGPLITSVGTGTGGADESVLQSPLIAYGSIMNSDALWYVADDFVVTRDPWQVTSLEFYGYQTYSGLTSTLTGVYAQIWNGDPRVAGSEVIWGDLTTNRMSSASYTNINRTNAVNGGNARPIMKIVANTPGLTLNPGTYWIQWGATGSSTSGPWCPPITITGTLATGNAIQWDGSAWAAIAYNGYFQAMPFRINRTNTGNPALPGNYAFLNSYGYGSGNSQNADLITPSINLTGYSNVILNFSHYFRELAGTSGTVSYSINNGSTWTVIQSFTASTANPASFSQVIGAVAGQSQVKFKWNYTGTFGWYWAVDNIAVTGVPATLWLSDLTIPTGVSGCYNASQTITAAGSGKYLTVANGGSVTLIAGQNILFLPTSGIKEGGYLHGYIAPSGPFCTTPSIPDADRGEQVTGAALLPGSGGGNLFRVYPNPTTGLFTLEFGGDGIPARASVTVYGMKGEEVLKKEISSNVKTELSLVDKRAGIYVIRVVSGFQAGSVKIVKQ